MRNAPRPGVPAWPVRSGLSSTPPLRGDSTWSIIVSEYLPMDYCEKRLNVSGLLGRYVAATRAKLREVSKGLGVRHVVNLAGCPAR